MKKIRLSIYSFLISIITLLVIYFLTNRTPFGTNASIVWDMEFQFSSFMSWFGSVLKGDADFIYTLRGALGGSSIGLYAYYLASPLNFLLIFFNEKNLLLGVCLIYLLKVGLSAFTMQWYLYSKEEVLLSIPFSCMYALSSFALCFQYNTMWMDAYFCLPIIVYCIDKLIDGYKKEYGSENWKLHTKAGIGYSFVLGICLLANYYIGYMICMFCVVYFMAMLLAAKLQKANVKYLKLFGSFSLFSVLGGGLSAGILLPGVLTLQNSSSGRVLGLADILDFSLIYSPLGEIKYLFARTFDKAGQGIHGEYPMLYAGSVVVFLLILFFISKEIKLAEKIAYGALLLVLALSMTIKGLFLIWSGFSMPSGCHERFAFLWVFVVLVMAYKVTKSSLSRKGIIVSVAVTLLLVAVSYIQTRYTLVWFVNVVLIVLEGAIIITLGQPEEIFKGSDVLKKYISRFGVPVLTVLVCVELCYNGSNLLTEQFSEYYLNADEYNNNYETYSYLEGFTEKEKSDDYRSVVVHSFGRSFNQGFLHNINGINMYASTESENTWQIYGMLGMGAPDWESEDEYDRHTTPLASDLLGVRYVYSSSSDFTDMKLLEGNNGVNLYENADALPFAFLVNKNALELTIDNYPWITSETEKGDIYGLQNSLIKALYSGENLYDDLYTIVEADKDGLSRFPEYEITKPNRIYRLEDGRFTDGVNIATENSELREAVIKENKSFTNNCSIKKSKINAKLTNPSNETQFVCISVPFEEGWSAKVDGEKIETAAGMGGLLLVPIAPGTHSVSLIYHTRGLAIGIIISSLALIVLLVIASRMFTYTYSKREKI